MGEEDVKHTGLQLKCFETAKWRDEFVAREG
jgi:hypothetical protein